ncbi:MAG: MFS transporter [Candidatus Promineifilaceae bacterium]|nr:MFS transporter [Candidatus Promineifilaceae bacterium]
MIIWLVLIQSLAMSEKEVSFDRPTAGKGLDQADVAGTFQADQVGAIAAAHFTHDTYSGFLAPLLPLLRTNLGLTYTQAGSLVIISQLASLLNPFIGYVADRVSVRYFVIFAPAVTGTLFSIMGLAPNYLVLLLILFAAGVSIAAFHAPAPAMIGKVSGPRIGKGMSAFMAAGELARAVGPLVVVAGVGWFGLAGIWRLAIVGWLVSGFLYFRLKKVPVAPRRPGSSSLDLFWPRARRIFPVLTWLLTGRIFMLAALTTYLAIFIRDDRQGTLWLAASALTILEAAGFVGALLAGTVSDRFGRNRILLLLMSISPFIFLAFIYGPEWLAFPLLVVLGFTAISPQPVMLALVQDQFPDNRALGNGTFLAINFLIRAFGVWVVGLVADRVGLTSAFTYAALLAFISIPAVFFLPRR